MFKLNCYTCFCMWVGLHLWHNVPWTYTFKSVESENIGMLKMYLFKVDLLWLLTQVCSQSNLVSVVWLLNHYSHSSSYRTISLFCISLLSLFCSQEIWTIMHTIEFVLRLGATIAERIHIWLWKRVVVTSETTSGEDKVPAVFLRSQCVLFCSSFHTVANICL